MFKGLVMAIAILTSKGQVTIPVAVRTALGLNAGSQVEFIEIGPGKFAMIAAPSPVLALKGVLRPPLHPVTAEDMNEAIARQGARAR